MTDRRLAQFFLAAVIALSTSAALALPGSNTAMENGKYINGKYINGKYINGKYINGVALSGGSINGYSIESLSVVGSQLQGFDENGTYVAGAGFLGATLQVGVVDYLGNPSGEQFPVTVDSVRQGEGAKADVFYYGVTYETTQTSTFCMPMGGSCFPMQWPVRESICPTGAEAIAMAGTWDYRSGHERAGGRLSDQGIVFACTDTALGKCIDFGYKPWAGYYGEKEVDGPYEVYFPDWGWFTLYGVHREMGWIDMKDAHQSCTRMVRGDYCGDGYTATVDGTAIEVTDTYTPQVNSDSRPGRGIREAVWSPNGAECVVTSRYEELWSSDNCVCGVDLSNGLYGCPTQSPIFTDQPNTLWARSHRVKKDDKCDPAINRVYNEKSPDYIDFGDIIWNPGFSLPIYWP